MAVNGIDVSRYQGSIDFKKVKSAGIEFVIIRAGYGRYASQKDPCFEENYKGAKAVGLKVGAYWYSYAVSSADAVLEAKACMEVIKGKKFDYPIYFDLEEQSQFAKGREFCDNLVRSFCGELEKNDYFAGLYISRSPLQNYISDSIAKRYALWIAEYGPKCNYDGAYGMWQYSSTGKISGINGNVDCNYCYIDYPKLIKSAGLNGYPKSESETKILDTDGFKKGDKSLGVYALKILLMREGAEIDDNQIFGVGTEKAVNSYLKKWGYKQNGIAGEKFLKMLNK